MQGPVGNRLPLNNPLAAAARAALQIQVGGETIHIRGVIDRVDRDRGWTLAHHRLQDRQQPPGQAGFAPGPALAATHLCPGGA